MNPEGALRAVMSIRSGSCTCKQCQEALTSTVDNIDFMQGHGMDDLASLRDLALRRLNELHLRCTLHMQLQMRDS